MQKHLQKCMWLLCLIISTTVFAQTNVVDPTRGVLRVKLQQEVAAKVGIVPASTRNGIVATGIEPFDRASRQVKAVKMERVFPYVEKMEAKARKHGLHLWYEVRFDESMDPKEAAQIFSRVPGVSIAENIVPMQLQGNPRFVTVDPLTFTNYSTKAATMPFNDPFLSRQWHYTNDGTMNGSIAGSDINLFEAWKIATGDKNLIVAIIDGGIDYEHPDLKDNILINEAELNGAPGVDNDKNGYVGDIYGYNFVTKSADIYGHSHGTHVAGTVGAVNNNGIGVAGVAGGNGQGGVKLLSCQVFDSRSSAQGDFAGAFYYAAVRGASIAQCSWGWGSAGYYEQAVLDAVKFFTDSAESEFMKGGLCIFANGNTGTEGDFYPACMEEVIAVGAMTYDVRPAPYSSYGDWVDITAPGGLMDYNGAEGVYSTLPNGQYGYNEGTSMACPHVSGIAALVLSKYGNPNFPNETLRQQLLTSVNDFYTRNPEVIGKFGSGYIDAWKALQMGNGNAPQPVSDFSLLPGQDNVLVEWNIPASDDNNVNYHIIYYSTSEFNAASDLSKLSQKRVDTKFFNSGDPVSNEVSGLSPTTTYYFALKAVDRWGNASELSAIKSATTNAGPKMELDKNSLSITIDANTSNIGSTSFVISNTDKGLLKWESMKRTVSVYPSAVVKPIPGKQVAQRGFISALASTRNNVVSSEYVTEDYPINLTYAESVAAYIGESDLSVSNSIAQWYYVDPSVYPNGFNLTDLYFEGFCQYESTTDVPLIQIYDGNKPMSKEGLLLEFQPQFFASRYDVQLGEQIYFAPGNKIWVVAHFKAGVKNPLGASLATNAAYKAYSFYSSNMGETWTQLSEVLREGNLSEIADQAVWGVTAKSKNPDWSSVVILDPSLGTVRSGETQTVNVSNDGQKLVNGNYKFNINLTTNEAGNNSKNIPVQMTVKGYNPELNTAKVVSFGNLLLGQTKALDIEVVNSGYGSFTGDWGSLGANNITCSSDQFEVPGYQTPYAARSTSNITVKFKPTKAGSHSGTVKLTDKNGISHSFVVTGVADEPAKISVTPNSFDLGDLEVDGDTKEIKFSISNTGKYPLEYLFPKFSNEEIENSGKSAHKYGYSYVSNLNGDNSFAYDGNPDLLQSTDITDQFTDMNYWSKPVPLGFTFPYYGTDYTEVYVTSYGAIAISNEGTLHACLPPSSESNCVVNTGLITMYGFNQLVFTPKSKVEYGNQDGKFVVKFANVLALKYGKDYSEVSFHMTLSPSGNIEFFYDNINNLELFQNGQALFVALVDIKAQDPFVITDNINNSEELYTQITSGTAIKFNAPGKSLIQSLSSTNGVVGIGETKEISAVIGAKTGMYAGELKNSLTIVSNDPIDGTSHVNLTANIVGKSLKPVAEVKSETVDFGNVFRTATAKLSVGVSNTGTNLLTINDVKITNNKFNFDLQLPYNIEAGTSKDIVVTLPTEAKGAVEDEMVITCADGTVLKVALKGTVIGVPVATVTPEAITATIESGSALTKSLKIVNKGDEALEYSITPNSWFGIDDLEANESSKVSYNFAASANDKSVEYAWEDIETTGEATHLKQSYWLNNDFKEVELPYDVYFYGKKYNKLYIYGVGFVSFTYKDDLKEFPEPPMTLPTKETIYSNFLAPLWAYHFMDQTSTSGVYYQVKDDRVVISFMEYGNSVNSGVCFQVILNRDGKIKYQYKLFAEWGELSNLYGLVGMQNEDATEGILLPEYCIAENSAVEFYTIKSNKLEPFGISNVNLNFYTDRMAGEYQSEILINTNIPTSSVISVPVNLTLTGEPQAVFPTEVKMEVVKGTVNDDSYLSVPFVISNSGNANFKITNIDAPGMIGWEATVGLLQYYGTHIDDFWGDEFVGFGNYTPGTEIVVGKEPVRFKVMVMDNFSMANYNVPMTFTVEGLDKETVEVPFSLTITDAPALYFATHETRISGVSKEYKDNVDVMFANAGNYKLTYSLELDPSGVGAEEGTDTGGGVMPMTKAAPSAMSKALIENVANTPIMTLNETRSDNPADVPTNIEYKRSLYYPAYSGTNSLYLVGSFDKVTRFMAATQFTAPADGFNINSVYFYATIGNLKNVDIKAEIIQGNNVATGNVIGTGTLHIEKEDPIDNNGNEVYNGNYRLVKLDKDVFITPNETFYVRFTFPIGWEYSIGLVKKEEAVIDGRYLYCIGDSWNDAAVDLEGSYGPTGYITTCLEMGDGENWIKMLTPETEGTIEPDEMATVTVQLNAAAARMEKNNKAVLVVRSNDPSQPVVNYPIYLDLNGAPVITTPETLIYASEGTSSNVAITVTDEDGDSFELTLSDEVAIATFGTCEPAEGANVTIEKVDSKTIRVTSNDETIPAAVTVNVTLTPDFGDMGNHSFKLTATDAGNNSSNATVRYYVQHVNRAPEAVQQADIEIGLQSASEIINLNSLFVDPDGDDMTYVMKLSNDEVVDAFTTPESVIFVGRKMGEVTATITATDKNGASTTNSFNVKVVTGTGINDVETDKSVSIYPNPVVDFANVTINTEVNDEVVYRLYDTNGALLLNEVARTAKGQIYAIDMTGFVAGVYYLELEINGSRSTIAVMKR